MSLNTTYAQMLHRHVVIWVDEHIGQLGNNEKMKDRFRRITYPLKTLKQVQVQSAINEIDEQQNAQKQIFVFCGLMTNYIGWSAEYINKILMFDSDEELLIRLTNEIGNYLLEEVNQCDRKDHLELAAGLLDWLSNDADTLQRAACKTIRENIRERRKKLIIDHPNEFNN